MQKFRKRPVEVDTVQWTGSNEAELIDFTGHRFEAVRPEDRAENPEITAQVFDELHSTWVGVYTGQHIVRGVKGEFYPIAEDVLAATYEPVPAAANTTGNPAAAVEVRDPCPRCEGSPTLIPRQQMAGHMRDEHSEEQQ